MLILKTVLSSSSGSQYFRKGMPYEVFSVALILPMIRFHNKVDRSFGIACIKLIVVIQLLCISYNFRPIFAFFVYLLILTCSSSDLCIIGFLNTYTQPYLPSAGIDCRCNKCMSIDMYCSNQLFVLNIDAIRSALSVYFF